MEKRKTKTVNRISKAIILVCVIANLLIIISLSYVLHDISESCDIKYDYFHKPLDENFSVNTSAMTNISACANMSSIEASYCLNSLFKEIYVYNVSNDYKYENFSQIDEYVRKYGGDCHESSEWFSKAANKIGYQSSYVPITMGYDNNTEPIIRYMHAFATISDYDAYCILDQNMVDCHQFNSSELNLTKESILDLLQ